MAKRRHNKHNRCADNSLCPSCASPPSKDTILAATYESSSASHCNRFGPPRDGPHLSCVLDRRYGSARGDIPNFDGLIGGPARSCNLRQKQNGRVEHDNVLELCVTYPDRASRPSGDTSTLRTQEEWPMNDAIMPPGATRTSCKTRRLSSDALRRS